MNEEWFGICSKKPIGKEGNYILEPRAAYYILSQIHQYNPTDKKMNARKLKKHFKQISISSIIKKAKKSKN
jgi:proteasome assembly chaperone (PAC2) family protein